MKISIRRLLEYILVAALILNCHSVYEVGNTNLYFNVMIIIISLILLFSYKIVVNRKIILFIFFYCLFQVPIVIYAATISDYVYTYAIKYILFVIIFLILLQIDNNLERNLVQIFIKYMYILGGISLAFFLFATILHLIQPTGSFYINWSPARWVRSYYGIYFEVSKSHLFDYKNSSIFAESPINAALLGMALNFELFFDNNIKKSHIIILGLALLSTFSTNAFIVLAMSFFGIFWINYKTIVKSKFGKFFWIIIIIIVGVFALSISIYAYNYKKYAVGESFLVRSDDYYVALKALKNNPLFGVGFGNTTYAFSYMSKKRISTGNLGQSSDFAALIASGGIYFFSIYLVGFYGLFKKIEMISKKIMFIAILAVIFIVSRIGATLLFILFIVIGIHSVIVGKKNE